MGRSAKDLPTVRRPDPKMELGQRFKLLEAIKTPFWKAWYRDYLVTLQVRKRWLRSGPNFQLGDIVLVAENNLPPLRWKMARIEQLYSGNDDSCETQNSIWSYHTTNSEAQETSRGRITGELMVGKKPEPSSNSKLDLKIKIS